jgi:hypothetical protein
MFDGGQNAILGTLSAKIRVAYATRLLEQPVYRDLLRLAEIRNVFAHSLHRVTFEHDLVVHDCNKLTAISRAVARGWIRRDHPIKKAIEVYAHTVLVLYLEIKDRVNALVAGDALAQDSSGNGA